MELLVVAIEENDVQLEGIDEQLVAIVDLFEENGEVGQIVEVVANEVVVVVLEGSEVIESQ